MHPLSRFPGLGVLLSDIVPGTSPAALMAKSFDLLRWFSLLSLLCIIAIGAGLAFVLSRFMTENMLQRDAVVTQEFIDSLMTSAATPGDFAAGQHPGDNPRLQALFAGLARMPDVVRANVYGPDATVLWSSHAPFIGEKTGPNPELDAVLAGALQVEAGAVGDAKEEHVSFEDHADGTPFIEVYVPVRDRPGGRVIGAVELYKMPEALFAAIRRGNLLVWLSGAAGALLLYATLMGVVLRASRVMHEQQARIVAGERMSALGEMAGAVTHAIRNPLASIRSSAELLAASDPAAAESAEDIMREADRLDAWVRDFLVQERREDAAAQPVDINAMIAESLDGFAPALRRQAVELQLEAAAGLPPVKGSPTSLRHVFGSFVANALEAMPRGGRLMVRSRLDRRHSVVEIRIADTGAGLPRRAGRRASAAPATTKPRGLGVGLVLARQVVARHGGSLDLASARGKGTTVMIRLPAAA
jgi:signal transduction histidine kinase